MKKKQQQKQLVPSSKPVIEQRDRLSSLMHYRYYVIFLLSIGIYGNTIFNNYNLDDELVTSGNAATSQGIGSDNILKIFTQPYYQDNMGYSYGYRPLTTLSFTIEQSLFGESPHVSHFINLLLYALLCVLLLKSLELIFKDYNKWLPFLTIAIFACHPLHTEVVASIKNRDEILSFLFASLIFCTLFTTRFSAWVRLIAALFFFTCGMLCKPNLILMPALITIALLFFKKEKPVIVLLSVVLFSVISVYLVENITDAMKILYLAANVILCIVLFISTDHWRPIAYFKSTFDSSSGLINVNQVPGSAFSKIHLQGPLVYIFLVSNFLLALIIVYLSFIFSNPWLISIGVAIYVLELFFFQLDQALLLIFLIDIASLFLLSRSNYASVALMIRQDLFIFFIIFNLSVIVNLNGVRFKIAFAVSYCAFLVYAYFNQDVSKVSAVLLFYPAFAYLLRSHFYITRLCRVILFVIICFDTSDLFYSIHDFGVRINLFFDTAILIFVIVVFAISLFKVALRNIPAIFALSQLVFVICALGTFGDVFHNTREVLLKGTSSADQMQHRIVALQSTSVLPSAFNNKKLDRPLTFIEIPVDFKSPLEVRLGTSAYQFGRYVLLLFKPWPMSYYYGYKVMYAHHLTEPIVIFSLFILVGFLLVSFYFITKNKILSFALFFMVFSILPYLFLVSAIPGLLADRYTFQASFGFSILVAYGFLYLYESKSGSWLSAYIFPQNIHKVSTGIFMVLISVYIITSIVRNSEWKDTVTLMRHDISVVPESVQAQNLLGINLVKSSFNFTDATEQRNIREEALGHLKKAHELYPTYFNFPYDVGRVYVLLDVNDSALAYFKTAYSLNPDYPDLTSALADIYFAANDYQAAIPYLAKLIHDNPDNYFAYDKLSLAYFKINQPALSIQTNKDAIKRSPLRAESYVNIGICYLNTNSLDSAKAWFKKALQVNPNDNLALGYLQKMK